MRKVHISGTQILATAFDLQRADDGRVHALLTQTDLSSDLRPVSKLSVFETLTASDPRSLPYLKK